MTAPAKTNRLTLFIIIALMSGVALGFWLNRSYVQEENKIIANTTLSIAAFSKPVADSNNIAYAIHAAQKKILISQKNAAIEKRDKKLEPFSLLADIFLRLIKMIVAPLVFSTLVVGVAKLGDVKTVGRIGGKSLIWFFSASIVSLGLGAGKLGKS